MQLNVNHKKLKYVIFTYEKEQFSYQKDKQGSALSVIQASTVSSSNTQWDHRILVQMWDLIFI